MTAKNAIMKLYSFFRSSTSHRLRIALNLKGIAYEIVPIDLRSEAHRSASYLELQPQGLVPALVDGDRVLIQSPAIIEWLEETHPTPALLPTDADGRAHVRALAAIVGCDIHPLNNRRVLEALRRDFGADSATVQRWCNTWIESGFDAIEKLLSDDARRGVYCVGDAPTLADVYLIPQVESARRFGVDVARWPRITAVDAACAALEAFARAVPARQPDAV
jgi:maleylpyruvate isomerase